MKKLPHLLPFTMKYFFHCYIISKLTLWKNYNQCISSFFSVLDVDSGDFNVEFNIIKLKRKKYPTLPIELAMKMKLGEVEQL